jgi:hypothetical protein
MAKCRVFMTAFEPKTFFFAEHFRVDRQIKNVFISVAHFLVSV